MPHRRRPSSPFVTTLKAAELAWAAPQVVAHRVGRMARSGPFPSARDRDEFQRMWSEKTAAFGASWLAMTTEAVAAQQAFWWTFAGRLSNPWSATSPFDATSIGAAAWDTLAAGLHPIHRTAVANRRRLSKGR